MKNVPVPVYCRPLVEKDPTMKVSPALTEVGGAGRCSHPEAESWQVWNLGKTLSRVCSSPDIPVLSAVVCCGGQLERLETQ